VTKNSGMKKIPRKVPATMPAEHSRCLSRAARRRPRRSRARAATLRARTASEVIRIGRRRSCTACSVASIHRYALLNICLGKLDDQNRVLRCEGRWWSASRPGSRCHAQGRGLRSRARRQSPERRGKQDRGRDRPAFVQRRETQENDDYRQRIQQRRLRAGGEFLIGLAGEFDGESRRQFRDQPVTSFIASPELYAGPPLRR